MKKISTKLILSYIAIALSAGLFFSVYENNYSEFLGYESNPVNVQRPIATDGDSLYCKDIDLVNSATGTFTGDICSLVNDFDTEITDTTATNPKTFTIKLNRPIRTSAVAMGSKTGDFSNVKIFLNDAGGTTRGSVDDSANNTKYTAFNYSFNPVEFIEIVIEFHTADPVKIVGLFISKNTNTISQIQGQKPDGTLGTAHVTAGSNLKISLEEFETGISTNTNSQLRTTLYDEEGDPVMIVLNNDRNTNLDGLNGLNTNSMMFGRVSDTVVKNARLDASTEAFMDISYSHHEVHAGTNYMHRHNHAIAKAGIVDHLIITPNTTKWAHMIIGVEGISSTILVELYKNATYSATGTTANVVNRNGNFPDNNTTLIYSGPTISTTGTLVADAVFGAGRNSSGGGSRDNEELILEQDTVYLLRVTEQNIAATSFNVSLGWYEHTDRN